MPSRIVLVAVLEPGLEGDDAESRLGHRALAGRHVELLDLLERIRLDRGAHALADDVEKVDQDLAAEQPVDLVDAGPVALHQALDGAGLVAAVVVDVHLRVRVESIDDQADEPLEGSLLCFLRGRPDVDVAGLPIDLLDDPEQVFEADLGRPRVRLDVEEEVPRRRLREARDKPRPASLGPGAISSKTSSPVSLPV